MLVRYYRSGGHEPSDDELLEIQADGSFELRRVVSADCVGHFAGAIPAAQLSGLAEALKATKPEERLGRGMPPRVTEEIRADGLNLLLDRNADLTKNAEKLVTRLRELCETLRSQPVIGVALDISKDGKTATVSAVGERPARADFSGASLSWTLFGTRHEYVDSGSAEVGAKGGELAPGTTMKVVLKLPQPFKAQQTLQVQMDFALEFPDHVRRECRLSAIAGKGWK